MKTLLDAVSVKIQKADLSKMTGDLLVLSVRTDGAFLPSGKDLNQKWGKAIENQINAQAIDFKADKLVWSAIPQQQPSRILFVATGAERDKKELPRPIVESWISATKSMLSKNVETVSILLEPELGSDHASQAIEGALLGLYAYEKPGKGDKDKKKKIKSLIFLVSNDIHLQLLQKRLPTILSIVRATFLTRDLVNQPANVVNPSYLSKLAGEIAKKQGLKEKTLDEAALKKNKMNLIMAVGMGSVERPRLIHLEYQPKQKAKKKIALVGKGVTFDSGGLSLKPQANMYGMKSDMAACAAVLSVASIIKELNLPLHIHFITPVVENLVSDCSVKPGDVFVAHNGKSVEIENTDAEGRLILADALSYAEGLGVDYIIDAATLTGAVVIALGDDIAGAMGTDDSLIQQIIDCGTEVGEKFWKLPLEKDYSKLLKSDVADMKNVGGRAAGSIVGGLFLSEFVEKTPWVHLDIAGPSFSEKDTALLPKGGTGFAVRTFVRLLEKLSN